MRSTDWHRPGSPAFSLGSSGNGAERFQYPVSMCLCCSSSTGLISRVPGLMDGWMDGWMDGHIDGGLRLFLLHFSAACGALYNQLEKA